jgi:hypothetical protein
MSHRSRATITGGPFKGLIIRSAYDPSVVKFGGTTFIAFECTLENGESFGIQQTSSCMAAYDPSSKSIDMSRATVIVSGDKHGNSYQVASVPRLLSYRGKLYLYWSAIVITNGQVVRAVARGGELNVKSRIPFLRANGKHTPRPFDASSVEVWAPNGSPKSDGLANIMSFAKLGDAFIVFAAVGGGGCTAPDSKSPSCFRLILKSSRTPLKYLGFGSAEGVGIGVPTNPQEYALPVVDPNGHWWVLGHFIRPAGNGSFENVTAPNSQFWAASARPSTLALIPMVPPK